MKSSRTFSLAASTRWGKVAARLGSAGRHDFQFLAAIAETDAAQDGRLRERLAAIRRADQARRQAAVAES